MNSLTDSEKLVFGQQLQISIDYGSSEGSERLKIDHAWRQTIPSDSNTLTKTFNARFMHLLNILCELLQNLPMFRCSLNYC